MHGHADAAEGPDYAKRPGEDRIRADLEDQRRHLPVEVRRDSSPT